MAHNEAIKPRYLFRHKTLQQIIGALSDVLEREDHQDHLGVQGPGNMLMITHDVPLIIWQILTQENISFIFYSIVLDVFYYIFYHFT